MSTAAGVPTFPGRVIAAGSSDRASILSIQKRLNEVGCGPVTPDGNFGPETLESVELFQARFADSFGQALTIDGRVGPMTWATLFQVPLSVSGVAPSPLAGEAVATGLTQVGVRESPLGSNSGPEVDRYLASVGAAPGSAWCAAFVYWCFEKSAQKIGAANPAVRTAGALDLWNKAGAKGIRRLAAQDQLAKIGEAYASVPAPDVWCLVTSRNINEQIEDALTSFAKSAGSMSFFWTLD